MSKVEGTMFTRAILVGRRLQDMGRGGPARTMGLSDEELFNPPPNPLRHQHVIVAGFGPVGRTAAQKLETAGVRLTVVDLNAQALHRQVRLARQTLCGDVACEPILRQAGVEAADALILTIPNEAAAIAACRIARRLNPDIYIAARTGFLSQGMLATQAGADHVVVEEIVTAEAMQQAVVQYLLA